MEYEEEPKEPNFTSPKLLLFSQRFNKPEPQGGCTPPPHTIATIPFQWEEAPGKPRSTTTTTTTNDPPQKSKSLHLPPKMFTKIGFISSPTNVLDGPYSSSPESVVSKSKWKMMMMMMMPLRKKILSSSPVKLSSWSLDSFRDISSRSSSSSSFDDTFSNSFDSKIKTNKVSKGIKTNKVSKGRNLRIFDKTTSRILESMYTSINQAVPWRRY